MIVIEEDLPMLLNRAATKGSVDMVAIKRKIILEMSELCYQDGKAKLLEEFREFCNVAVKRAENLSNIIKSFSQKRGNSYFASSFFDTTQQSGKIVWMWKYVGGGVEIFTAPIEDVEHLMALKTARILPLFKIH